MDDLHKHTQAHMRLRSGTASIVAPAEGREGEGEVGRCGHWDAEYDGHGYCRDRDCKSDRLVKALQSGSAWRMPDGTLIWFVK
jgi:hypothetical protein